MDIGMKKTTQLTFDQALEKVPEAMKTEGFGILTRIDVQATLKEKIGADFRRYTILGACNPNLAHQALTKELGVGVMLPCNVVVYEGDDKKAVVTMVDPLQTIAPQVSKDLEAFATEVRAQLVRAMERI